MSPPIGHIRGVTLRSYAAFDADGKATAQKYFEFDLSQITWRTLWGYYASPDDEPPGEWKIPLGNLANWVFPDPHAVVRRDEDHGTTVGSQRRVRELVALLEQEELNQDANLDDALDPDRHWIRSHLPDDHPQGPGAPVVLVLKATTPGLADFGRWHSERITRAEKYTQDAQCSDLRATLGAAVERLQFAFAERTRARKLMMPFMQQFAGGKRVIDMCLDFADKPAVREKRWGTWRLAGSKYLVVPPPDAAWIARAEVFGRDWDQILVRACARVGNSKYSADLIDIAGREVISELRDGAAPYLAMLQDWDTLCPAAQAELNNTLRDVFGLCLQCPRTREQLLTGEVGAMAVAAGSAGEAIVPSVEQMKNTPLRDAMAGYNDNYVGSFEPTPLGKLLSEALSKVEAVKKYNGIAFDLLGLATPFVVGAIKARRPGEARSACEAMAWIWKSLIGTTRIAPHAQRRFLAVLKRFDGGGDVLNAALLEQEIFDHKKGLLASAYAAAEVHVHVGIFFARIFLLHYAAEESRDDPSSLEKKLERLKTVAEFGSSAFELVADAQTSKTLIKWVQDNAGNKLQKVEYAVAVGLVADALGVAIALEKYRKSAGKTEHARDAARLDVLFDSMSFAVSVIAALTGAEFVVVGLLLYLVKNFVTDLDAWAPLIPFAGISKKAGPHEFLETMLRGMLDDEDKGTNKLDLAIAQLEVHGAAEVKRAIVQVLELLTPAPREGTALLWDMGGEVGLNWTPAIRRFVGPRYLLTKPALKIAVRPCRHG